MIKFTILISTKDRLNALRVTLKHISNLIDREDVECIIYDDGSKDGTSLYIQKCYPKIILITNQESRGYMYCRNMMLNKTSALYAISLDDDAHFITENPLEIIENYFEHNNQCGVLAFRLFWGLKTPKNTFSKDKETKVQGFVGCGHVWRVSAWKEIPNYPEWFVFYGEEEFASYELFKRGWSIHYIPEVLVQHRVDIRLRKNNADYTTRLRRSLRSGWYLYFLFYPIKLIPKKLAYSLYMQLKEKVMKGDFKVLLAIILALFDLVKSTPKIVKNSNRFSNNEFVAIKQLPQTKIYWKPE